MTALKQSLIGAGGVATSRRGSRRRLVACEAIGEKVAGDASRRE